MIGINQRYLSQYKNPLALCIYRNYKPLLSKNEVTQLLEDGLPSLDNYKKVQEQFESKYLSPENKLRIEDYDNGTLKKMKAECEDLFITIDKMVQENIKENFRELLGKLEVLESRLDILIDKTNPYSHFTNCFIMMAFHSYETWVKIHKSVKNLTKLQKLSKLRRRVFR